MAQAPLDRLAAEDFYNQLDHLVEDWDDDEWRIARKLQRLRRHFEHLPTPYWTRAQPLLAELGRARLVTDYPWRGSITLLRLLVSEWDNSRPPLLECEECGLLVRGHRRLLEHRGVVHGYEEVA